MPKLGTKPALALGATAAMIMGVGSVTAQARVTATGISSTTPSVQRGYGGGFADRASAAALAKNLGVSVADLNAAVKAVRAGETKPDHAAERASQANAIADALGVEQAVVATALAESAPINGDRRAGAQPADGAPKGTTPPAGAPKGTTPPAGNAPPAGSRPGGLGFGGPRGATNNTALIAAIVKATGKDEATVRAALAEADALRDAARTARQAEFARLLAAQLGLDEAKVAAAIEAGRPTPPARTAKEATSQAK